MQHRRYANFNKKHAEWDFHSSYLQLLSTFQTAPFFPSPGLFLRQLCQHLAEMKANTVCKSCDLFALHHANTRTLTSRWLICLSFPFQTLWNRLQILLHCRPWHYNCYKNHLLIKGSKNCFSYSEQTQNRKETRKKKKQGTGLYSNKRITECKRIK